MPLSKSKEERQLVLVLEANKGAPTHMGPGTLTVIILGSLLFIGILVIVIWLTVLHHRQVDALGLDGKSSSHLPPHHPAIHPPSATHHPSTLP